MTMEQGAFAWLVKRGMDWLSKGRLAKTSGRLRLSGLKARVEVIRDSWGVPHIYAENDSDLYFAQGYVHAQDRFWQMEFQRRLVSGRLSELIGEAAVHIDRWMRMLGMQAIARQEYEIMQRPSRLALDAYSAGVNAWLKHRRLPVEFALLRAEPERWSPVDSLGYSKMMGWMLSANWEAELLRQQIIDKLGPIRAAQLEIDAEEAWPLVLVLPDMLHLEQSLARLARPWSGPGAGEGIGSNNWVIAGSRTASGKPLLANDMHLLLNAPAIWYENHLVSDTLNVTGVSLPGLPLVVSGHNEHVAWGFTAGFADVQDLFEEHLRRTPEGTVEYEFRGEWRTAEVRLEEICIRGKANVYEEVIVTHHGPIITPLVGDEARVPLALNWTASEVSGGTLQAMNRMNHARNCAEFREAMRTWNTPVLNVVYADVDGNIAYTLAGKVPIREKGEGKVPVPGWTGTHEWVGVIPFDELPHIENPEIGYIATANNRTAGTDYPYYLGRDYITGDRAERIIELILTQPVVDVAHIQKMQRDQVSPSAQSMARLVGGLTVDSSRLKEVVARMQAWNGELAVDSPAGAIYEVLTRQLLQVIFENRLGELMPRFAGAVLNEVAGANVWAHHAWDWLRRELLRPDSPWFDLGGGETRDDVLRIALQRTVEFITAEQGEDIDSWAWGRFHKLAFQHVLGRMKPLNEIFNRGPYPVGGDGNTIWATATLLDRVDSSDGIIGPPFRFIADLSDLSQSLGVLAPGQSGQVGSPHYDDQIEAWFHGEYHPMLFRREDVLRGQAACLELLP